MAFQSLAPVIFESVSQVTATNSVELGTKVTVDGNEYLYVYYGGTTQAIPGHGVTATGVSGYTVTHSSTTMVDAFIGVVYHTTMTTGTYGWVVTRGFSKVKAAADTGVAAGDQLTPGANGTWSPNTVVTNAVAPLIQGKCVSATASAGVGFAYVNCLG